VVLCLISPFAQREYKSTKHAMARGSGHLVKVKGDCFLISIRGVLLVAAPPSSPNRRKVRVIASCLVVGVVLLMGTPPLPPFLGGMILIGSERIGSGILPILGSRKSITEDVTVDEGEDKATIHSINRNEIFRGWLNLQGLIRILLPPSSQLCGL
jgi:hypothetical protein